MNQLLKSKQKKSNSLARAFNEMKDEMSLKHFNQHYADLTDKDKIDAINKAVPVRISEAEPEEY